MLFIELSDATPACARLTITSQPQLFSSIPQQPTSQLYQREAWPVFYQSLGFTQLSVKGPVAQTQSFPGTRFLFVQILTVILLFLRQLLRLVCAIFQKC